MDKQKKRKKFRMSERVGEREIYTFYNLYSIQYIVIYQRERKEKYIYRTSAKER